jgi:hypothetical protein
MSLTSLAATPTSVLAGSPSTSTSKSSLANTFAAEETSFTPSSVNINASDGKLRHINCQISSLKPGARHSLLKELNLASISELTLRKRKLYERIWNKESVLCKLKKKYKAKKLEKLCFVESDPLMENLLSSLTVEAASLLAAIVQNSRQKPNGRRWNSEDPHLSIAKSPICSGH